LFKVYNKTEEKLAAEGYLVVFAVDKNSMKATKIPEEIVERLTPYMET